MRVRKINLFFFLGLFLLIFSNLSAQRKIEHIRSDKLQADPSKYGGNPFFSGNVMFEHDGSTMQADTVILFQKDNSLWAKSRVRMNIGDTVFLACKTLEYNGNTRQAVAKGNVVLKDPSQQLETEDLFYDRTNNKAYFNSRSKITQGENVMYSNYGVYDLNTRSTHFKSNVDIETPEYKINSTDLQFNNYTGKTILKYPSTITSKENPQNYIYTEDGEYNVKTKKAFLRGNSEVHSNGKVLTGEEMFFDQNTDYGYAKGDFKLNDPKERTYLKGGYGEYFQKQDSAMATQNPYIVKAFKKDSLYISADTLITKRDSAKLSNILGFHKVRVYKTDLQAKCDSLHFKESKGIMTFYQNPVFWNSYRQITGDTIRAFSNVKLERLDSIHVLSNAFAISKTDSLTTSDFNQVKGRFMLGFVENEELRYVKVQGNAESVIFVDDEDKEKGTKKRIGINKSLCGVIEADFYEREIHIIECNNMGEGRLYPVSQFPSKMRYLDGFVWREKERPKRWQDIFLDVPEGSSSDFSPIDGEEIPTVEKEDINIENNKIEDINESFQEQIKQEKELKEGIEESTEVVEADLSEVLED